MKPAALKALGGSSEESLFDAFANRIVTVRILSATTLLFLCTSAVGPLVAIYLAHEPERAIVISDDGTVTIARLLRFKDALAFHKLAANQSAFAMLNRSPAGLDDSDLIELMFNQKGKAKVSDLLKTQDATFREYSYHQKAEIEKTQIAADPDGTYRARIQGQLIRTGIFNQLPKLDRLNFTLILYLFRNESAVANKQYPLGVWNFDYSESR